MQRILPHCTEDSLSKHGKSWIELSCQAAVKVSASKDVGFVLSHHAALGRTNNLFMLLTSLIMCLIFYTHSY